jgi:hypothetical protein
MSRKQRGMLLILGLLAVASISAWHLVALQRSGQPVFWLAELWAPVGVLSIGLVSCLEYLLPPRNTPSVAAKPRVARRSRRKA